MAYQQMASLYDELMTHAPYDEWVDFTEQIFKESGKSMKKIADLGCGTGEITTKLASKGYEMIGVDYSQDMLTYAENKANNKNLDIKWLHQDIKELEGLNELDAAISYCDVLNYITEPEQLQLTFDHVYKSLKVGGLFLFDVHGIDYIMDNYINQTFADVTDEASYVWFCTPGEAVGEMYHDLTFFYLNDGKYERFDEQHHQRTFQSEFYINLLISSGFENVKVYADFSVVPHNTDENAARIFFSATKGPR